MKDFLAVIGVVSIVLLAATLIRRGAPLDSTDNHVTGQRSNMEVLIDHGTGLQYLRASGGGITPRLDVDGKHMRAEVTR